MYKKEKVLGRDQNVFFCVKTATGGAIIIVYIYILPGGGFVGEGGIASSSLFFTCSGTFIVYFVCALASELERWVLLPFWGFS